MGTRRTLDQAYDHILAGRPADTSRASDGVPRDSACLRMSSSCTGRCLPEMPMICQLTVDVNIHSRLGCADWHVMKSGRTHDNSFSGDGSCTPPIKTAVCQHCSTNFISLLQHDHSPRALVSSSTNDRTKDHKRPRISPQYS